MRITVEIDDDEIRRLLAPLAQPAPTPLAQTMTRLLNVREVADRLGVSRNKVYELLNRGEIHSLAIGRTRRSVLTRCSRRVHFQTERERGLHPTAIAS